MFSPHITFVLEVPGAVRNTEGPRAIQIFVWESGMKALFALRVDPRRQEMGSATPLRCLRICALREPFLSRKREQTGPVGHCGLISLSIESVTALFACTGSRPYRRNSAIPCSESAILRSAVLTVMTLVVFPCNQGLFPSPPVTGHLPAQFLCDLGWKTCLLPREVLPPRSAPLEPWWVGVSASPVLETHV